eukprot:8258573-Heterocapsa_arctica.AAC.1
MYGPRCFQADCPSGKAPPEDHAEVAWSTAKERAAIEGLNHHRETSLPYKVSSYGRLGRVPNPTRSGATRN